MFANGGLDRMGLLGAEVVVVGTNAFAAYEQICCARFPVSTRLTRNCVFLVESHLD